MYSHLMLTAGVLYALFASVSPAATQGQIPCDHPLRLVLPPSLFSHCETSCTYSNWTAWQTIQTRIPTNKTTCASKYYDIQQQTRELRVFIGNSADCNDVNQTRKLCEFRQFCDFILELNIIIMHIPACRSSN